MKKMYKIILFIIMILIIIFTVKIYIYNKDNEKNVLKNIDGKYTDKIIANMEDAKASLEDVKENLCIVSINDELQEDVMDETSNIVNTYKFKQIYNGVEVYKSGVIIYTDKFGNANGIINYLSDIKDININPHNSEKDIERIIKNEYGEDSEILQNNLIIYPHKNENILAYKCKVCILKTSVGSIYENVIIDDKTGKIINKNKSIRYFEKNDLEYFLTNDEYVLNDTERGIVIYKPSSTRIEHGKTNFNIYSWNKSQQISNDENLALEAICSLQKCFDYYKSKFSYISFTGNGINRENGEKFYISIITNAKTVVTKKETIKNFDSNAAYAAPYIIVIGNDNIYNSNMEVLGHEYTHGIFDHITNTESDMLETSALDEAYADIMGMCIEAYYNGVSNIDGYISSSKGRDIKNSKVKYENLPRNAISKWANDLIKREEHYYSMIISRAAYLMSQHMTLKEFETLWFNSMKLLPKNPKFVNCTYAVIKMAKMMNLTNEQQIQIKEAFKSVGLNDYEEIMDSIKDSADNIWDTTTVTNLEIIGTWEATGTNNNVYSLGTLYGSAFSYGNELTFRKDGTYVLGIGATYWQEGNYQIDGNIIKLNNIKDKGDNPDSRIIEQLLIKNENNKKQIILEEPQAYDVTVEVIFENIENTVNNDNLKSSTETIKATAGEYTLEYGTYANVTYESKSPMHGVYTINEDGTFTCTTVDGTATGTYTIKKENYENSAETLTDWLITFTSSNKDIMNANTTWIIDGNNQFSGVQDGGTFKYMGKN